MSQFSASIAIVVFVEAGRIRRFSLSVVIPAYHHINKDVNGRWVALQAGVPEALPKGARIVI